MRIEQYFLMTDYSLWEARETLLMALLDKHQLNFNIHKDAKHLMEDIEKRFEVKSSSSTSPTTQNIAFVSSQNIDSTNESVSPITSVSATSTKVLVSALPNVDNLSDAVIYSFFASQSNSPHVMVSVAMIRAFRQMKNQQTMPSWHSPPQVLPVMIMSSESDVSMPTSLVHDMYKLGEGYHVVPPPSKPDLVFYDSPTASEIVPNVLNVEPSTIKPNKDLSQTNRPFAPIIKDWVSDSEDESEGKPMPTQKAPSFVQTTKHVKTPMPFVKPVEYPTPAKNFRKDTPKSRGHRHSWNRKACFVCKSLTYLIKDCDYYKKKMGNPHQALKDKGVIDSGCSRHMTGNIPYLSEFEEINESYVTFGGNPKGGKITGKGIKREFSVARTLQQNVIAKKKNRTLIEAARTMLANSLLHILFWAEAVNTTCYVQNRVLVTKPHNKTPYELLLGKTPSIGFLRPFGCHVTIINTLDPLGKFNGKADEGFLVGYSVSSKAFKETAFVQQYVLLPLWSNGSKDPQNIDANATFDVKEPELNTNGVNDASTPVSAVEPNSTNSINNFNVVGPFNNAVSLNFELGGKSSFVDPSQYPDDPNMPALEDITYSNDEEDVGAEADFSNLETNITGSPIPTTRVHKDHPVTQIIGDLSLSPQTRSMARMVKEVHQALYDPSWIEAMQEELFQFKMQKEEGINYEEVFAPVARIEAIRLFLAYASFMGFMVYQIDVKNAFLYGTIKEEVYVCQPPRFEDPDYPDKVYKVVKALYGLHQALRAWYETLANYLLENSFQKGNIDQTLFIKKQKASTPIDTKKPLLKDPDGEDVDVHIYRSMIGSLMYLTSSRPDIMFAVYACARFQVTPKASHLHAVKRIFRGSHETFQCQPITFQIDFSGSDQIQTPQYPDIHLSSQETSDEVFQANHSIQNEESFENSSNKIVVSSSNPEEPSQDSDIHQLIEECSTEIFKEQKQSMEDTMLELVKICQEKEFLCIHDNVNDLIESDLNSKLLAINSQRLKKEQQEVKNVVEQPGERENRITPILLTKEPEHLLSMGYEHLSITPERESDEVTESNGENLLPIPSECEVALEDKRECDVPISENSPVCDNHSDTFSDFKIDDDISVYDDDFEDIEYIKASLPDSEIVSVEEESGVEVENIQDNEKVDFEDISQIQDIVLREKLLSITRLICNIESLNDNSTPNLVLNSFESDNSLLDNFSPKFETFCDHSKETRSGNTTHADNSLLEYDSFCFEIKLDQEMLINLVKNDIPDNSSNDPLLEEADLFLAVDNSIPSGIENFADDPEGEPPDAETDAGEEIPVVINNKDEDVDYSSFIFIFVKVFSLLSAESEDTIFDPSISD
nr:hypothetical protein [Tanacetum cinerariifolium]